MKPSWTDIEAARVLLRESLPATPLQVAKSLSQGSKHVYLKNETVLPTGAFKVRGALYSLHAEMKKGSVREVVAASTGNHGAGVAYAAQKAGVPAAIFLPERSNAVKRARIADLGARIVEAGADITAALAAMRKYARETGAFMLDDSVIPEVPVATGTIGCEIVEQLPNATEIWVPMGDTALIRGVATAAKHLRPSVRIVGVQAESAPSYYLSWKKGEVVETETCLTIADGLATRTPTKGNVADVLELVDDIRLVSDEQMIEAIRHLRAHDNVLAEPAGAAATAAWMRYGSSASAGEVALIVSGGNIAEEVLQLVS